VSLWVHIVGVSRQSGFTMPPPQIKVASNLRRDAGFAVLGISV
jgi:hypothetical protein